MADEHHTVLWACCLTLLMPFDAEFLQQPGHPSAGELAKSVLQAGCQRCACHMADLHIKLLPVDHQRAAEGNTTPKHLPLASDQPASSSTSSALGSRQHDNATICPCSWYARWTDGPAEGRGSQKTDHSTILVSICPQNLPNLHLSPEVPVQKLNQGCFLK